MVNPLHLGLGAAVGLPLAGASLFLLGPHVLHRWLLRGFIAASIAGTVLVAASGFSPSVTAPVAFLLNFTVGAWVGTVPVEVAFSERHTRWVRLGRFRWRPEDRGGP